MSNTLKTVFNRVVDYCFPNIVPRQFTISSGASATAHISTTAEYNKTSATGYDGLMMTCTANANSAGNAPEGESRLVTNWASSTKTFTTEAFSANVETSDTMTLCPLPKSDILEAINDIIRPTNLPRYSVLSLCNDANMEDASADVTTDWPDADGTPTQTKETTIVLTGKQSLKIVTTTVDHSVRSLSIPVTEQRQVLISCPVKCTAGSLRVQLYDVTNSAEIEGATTDEEVWTEVRFTANIPADCQNVQIRFISKTASTTAYVDWAGFYPQQSEIYVPPSMVTDASFIEGVFYLPQGYTAEENFTYTAFDRIMEPWPYHGNLKDYAGVNPQRIEITRACHAPLFLKYRAPDTALSTMASTTIFPLEELVAGASASILQKLAVIADKRGDAIQSGRLDARARVANRTYRLFLDSLSLAQPIQRTSTQRRVSAPSR